MVNETFFHIVFSVVFALVVILRAYFHAKAGTFRENVLPRTERPFTAMLRSVFGIPFFIAIFVYIVNPRWMAWAAVPLPIWLRWCGGVLAVVSVLGLVWVHSILGKNFSPTLSIKQEHALVSRGPYRWVRHPMYTVMFTLHIAYFLLTTNWFIGVTGILVISMVMLIRTKDEEAMMLERFGDQYREYSRRTGQFLPRFTR